MDMNETMPTCAAEGNADFYGLGIRTGFYLQWISTLLTTLFNPAEEKLLCATNIILQIAVASTVLLLTARSSLHTVEAFIAFWMLFGALSSVTGDGISPIGTVSGIARVLFYAGLCAYGCWFWFGGVDGMPLLGQDMESQGSGGECPSVVFFNNTQATAAWLRRVGQVGSVAGLVLCAGLMGWNVVRVWKGPGKAVPRKRRLQTDISLLAFSAGVIVLSITAVEHLIRANNITALDDFFAVGQLVPFLIGLFGLILTLLAMVKRRIWAKTRCWTLFGCHFT